MPQLILVAAVGAIAWYGYKAVTREMDRVAEKLNKADKKRKMKTAGELEQDPETGIYKPKKNDDV